MDVIENLSEGMSLAASSSCNQPPDCYQSRSYEGVLSANPTLDSIFRVLGGAPRDQPGIRVVIDGVLTSINAVIKIVEKPSQQLLEIENSIQALQNQFLVEEADTSVVPAGVLRGRLTDHPGWAMCLAMGSVQVSVLFQFATGVEILWGLVNQHPIPEKVARAIRRCANHQTPQGVQPVIDWETGNVSSAAGTPIETRLNKIFPKLLPSLCEARASRFAAEKLSFEYRARGQILGRANFGSISSRTGAITHRELSKHQLNKVCKAICSWIDSGDERAVAAVVTALSGLTVDLIHQIPLLRLEKPTGSIMVIDPGRGVLRTNLESLVREAAAGGSGAPTREGGFISVKPLPERVATIVRLRFEDNPSAQTLGDLFPSLRSLQGHHEITPTGGEIRASWARWLNTQVAILQEAGLDAWLTAITSNNFGATAKSKNYYAISAPQEIWGATKIAFIHLGWGEPVPMPDLAKGFGSRVVPTNSSVMQAYDFHRNVALTVCANGLTSVKAVLSHHNAIATMIGFQLVILLALRERRVYPLLASIDEDEQFILVHDKKVPGPTKEGLKPPGLLPVPICDRVRQLVKEWRLVCLQTRSELQRFGVSTGEFMDWLDHVILQKDVPLISLCKLRWFQTVALGSRHIFGTLPSNLALAPDAGRKLLENDLRDLNASAGDIDAVLRHEVKFQAKHALGVDFQLSVWAARVVPLIDALAERYFSEHASVIGGEA